MKRIVDFTNKYDLKEIVRQGKIVVVGPGNNNDTIYIVENLETNELITLNENEIEKI
jgi:hypothetical protein